MRTIITITFICISVWVKAQMGVSDFLLLVEKNNPEIIAAEKMKEAEKLNAQTGLTPNNPSAEYGYLPGNKPDIGNKTIYSISQSFEFPTIYQTRRKIANQQGTLTELEFDLFRMNKLLDAKNQFCQYIFLQKKTHEYARRVELAKGLMESYQKQFDLGNASILELNKARIQFLNISSDFELLKQELHSKATVLSLLCGNQLPENTESYYDEQPLLLEDSLFTELEAFHPELKFLQSNQQLADMKIKLAKQSWLPDLELGYQGEVEQDGTFRGFVGGISIPLWKEKNRVRLAKAQADYQETLSLTRKEIIMMEYSKAYEKAKEYQSILNNYSDMLKKSDNIDYLKKALDLGELSIIDYFNELSFFYETQDKFLEIELEYQLTLNELSDYKL